MRFFAVLLHRFFLHIVLSAFLVGTIILFEPIVGSNREATSARAEFQPHEVLLVANSNLSESTSLATSYLQARSIPKDNLISLPLSADEVISRETFEKTLLLPLREAILKKGMDSQARVLLLFWGVPLSVQAPAPDPRLSEYRAKLLQEQYRAPRSKRMNLSDIQSWRRILIRDKSFESLRLQAHLAYWEGRKAGLAAFLQDLEKSFSYQEAEASVDSEIAFLWYDRDEYPLRHRLENPFLPEQGYFPGPFPLLLVSRIDGPTPESARRLFEQAIQAERFGLSGKIYIDARGLAASSGPLGVFDQSLRDMAQVFSIQNTLPVILDNREERFSLPEAAPDVALYAGWYRLRNYEDAFRFNIGALGYHIASEECVSLHSVSESGWCKNAVQRGISSTLGATSEPFLETFPIPLEFFGILGTGSYQLVEAYALTVRAASWRMVLIGDPLYNPFRKAPLFSSKALLSHPLWPKRLSSLPIPPSQQTYPSPRILRGYEQANRLRAISEVQAEIQ